MQAAVEQFKHLTKQYTIVVEEGCFADAKVPSKQYIESKKNPDLSQFSLIRLNGVAALHSDLSKLQVTKPPYTNSTLRDIYIRVVDSYANLTEFELQLFNYSWENPDEFGLVHKELTSIQKLAIKVMSKTDILVVIGYSFPLFNRSVDKELMNALPDECRRIYVQDTRDNVNSIKALLEDSFENLYVTTGKRIKAVEYINQFFIPPDADI